MKTITVNSGKPFELRKGVQLKATREVWLVLPGAIWVQGEAIGKIIQLSSDDMEIGIEKTEQGAIRTIRVLLKPEQFVILHRNSEVVAVGKGLDEIEFEIGHE